MNKLLGWFLGTTKVGKMVRSVQTSLAGYKMYLVGAAIALPAIITMLQGFSDLGSPYLIGIGGTPEYKQLMEGFAIMAGRAAATKLMANKEPAK